MKRLCLVVAILSALCEARKEDVIVQLQNGELRGTHLSSRNNKTFYAFMGIPYAQPPVGDLRFKSPQPAGRWEGVRNATKEGSSCIQQSYRSEDLQGNEDCLFLNVFTPEVSRNARRPVMVWLHGGAYFIGSGGRDFAGPHYLIDEDVLFVSLNYRLGAFGFLNLETQEVPGNAGLKDQVLALRWVQENIMEFGGNPEKVTIVGESAGGSSVHFHILSPMSTGLFDYAISESGTGLNPWAFRPPNSSFASLFADKLGIATDDKNELLSRLQNCTAQEIFEASQQMISHVDFVGFEITFSPTTDTNAAPGDMFLPDTPLNLINSEIFNKVPYIVGTNSQEGIVFVGGIKKIINRTVEENIEYIIDPETISIEEDNNIYKEIKKKIEDFYFDENSDNVTRLQQYVDFAGDINFYNGVYCTVLKHTLHSTSPVYWYQFSYSGDMNSFKRMFGGEEMPGASHVDEMRYIYSSPHATWEPGSPELLTSERLLRMWANFAKTGNPTTEPEDLLQNIIWKPVEKSHLSYLNIDADLSIESDARKQNIDFWTQIFHNYTLNIIC